MLRLHAPFSYKSDPKVPTFEAGEIFTVMDAQCALCARGARWIAQNDTQHEFRILPIQSPAGRALLHHYGLDPDDPTTWLYVEYGIAYTSLDALARVGTRLGGIWRMLHLFHLLPEAFQNPLYRAVARNRYRLFGRADLCTLPDPEVRKRLIP
ncbi:hypothetical protein ROA7450_01065 [Roseovarius albus]|uniref:Thiol-disulfide oxidoreductase n=1 Tax=Roseovarius albus TaxID=1247867 RepID=A0A1X6YMC0_9RHOB|nr:DCC1-like thiol-disulfide oxidoreductase family protein [Roseovarius albus]SLN25753.1 hypothetical protein ROA7450_01065 [Roseovarius albus]